MNIEKTIGTIMDCLGIDESFEGIQQWKQVMQEGLEKLENGEYRN